MYLQQKFQLVPNMGISGLVVVFVVLTVIACIIKIYGKAIYGFTQKNKEPKAEMSVAPVSPAPKAPSLAVTASRSPVLAAVASKALATAAPSLMATSPVALAPAQEDIPGEILAAIAAAVYLTYEGSGLVIRSVKRASLGIHSVWGQVGRMESTRPF